MGGWRGFSIYCFIVALAPNNPYAAVIYFEVIYIDPFNHTGEKLYKGDGCMGNFHQKLNLREHQKIQGN